MTRKLAVHFLPDLANPNELAGGTAVVIDVLRATTTIVHALASGAREVIPCLEVEEACSSAVRFPAGEAVLGGERDGVRIEGFELGNSPSEYTRESVGSRTLVFTTTNGTRALHRCRQAARVLIGAFVNYPAVCRALLEDQRPVHLVCAGTRGEITREDVLLAGAIVDWLLIERPSDFELNDQAVIAGGTLRAGVPELAHAADPPHATPALVDALRNSQGGRNLISLGLDRDIEAAAQLDRFNGVPELEKDPWRIVQGSW
jgi:2-phosphosulfolactate phosphatase